jgi:hypothetical protein
MSLLDKARSIGRPIKGKRAEYSPEKSELAVAWFNGEVSMRQVAEVLEFNKNGSKASPTAYIYVIANIIKEAILRGDVEVIFKKKERA